MTDFYSNYKIKVCSEQTHEMIYNFNKEICIYSFVKKNDKIILNTKNYDNRKMVSMGKIQCARVNVVPGVSQLTQRTLAVCSRLKIK